MKTWKVPVYWNMTGTVEVTADTLKEAIDIVNRREMALPAGKYMDGSLSADDGDIEMIRKCYNNDQCDDHSAPVVPMQYRPEVTEVCPHCDREITLIWEPEKDGYRIYCPECGAKIQLCSMCPMRGKCDWKNDFYGEGHCSMMDKFFKVEVVETNRKTIFVKAHTPEEAEKKAQEVCSGMNMEYDDGTMECICDTDYTGNPYTDEDTVIIK